MPTCFCINLSVFCRCLLLRLTKNWDLPSRRALSLHIQTLIECLITPSLRTFVLKMNLWNSTIPREYTFLSRKLRWIRRDSALFLSPSSTPHCSFYSVNSHCVPRRKKTPQKLPKVGGPSSICTVTLTFLGKSVTFQKSWITSYRRLGFLVWELPSWSDKVCVSRELWVLWILEDKSWQYDFFFSVHAT